MWQRILAAAGLMLASVRGALLPADEPRDSWFYPIQAAVFTWLGDTKLVPVAPAIQDSHIRGLLPLLRPGDILLQREDGFLSNALLPGFWPHAILYTGTVEDLARLGLIEDRRVAPHLAEHATPDARGCPRRVIEAVSEGVLMSSLEEAGAADHLCAFRPLVTDAFKRLAIARAFSHVGKPYDFDFDLSTAGKIYCSELIFRCYADNLGFTPREILYRPAFPAIDILSRFEAERDAPDRTLAFVFYLYRDGVSLAPTAGDAEALIRRTADRRVAARLAPDMAPRNRAALSSPAILRGSCQPIPVLLLNLFQVVAEAIHVVSEPIRKGPSQRTNLVNQRIARHGIGVIGLHRSPPRATRGSRFAAGATPRGCRSPADALVCSGSQDAGHSMSEGSPFRVHMPGQDGWRRLQRAPASLSP